MVVSAEEYQETNVPQSDFEQRFKSTTIEVVPAESAQNVTSALYRKLAEKAQSFSVNPNNLDYESGRFLAQEWGGVLTIHGKDEDQDTQLTVLLGKDHGIIGYGAFTQQPDNTSQIAFKIFPEARGAAKSRDILKDTVFSHLATSLDTPSELRIPPRQQYNPRVEGKPTVAPIFYRNLGFYTEKDSTLPANLQNKLRTAQREKVPFDNNELILLSANELVMPIDDLGTPRDIVAKVKQSSIGNVTPIGTESAQLLAKSAESYNQTTSKKMDKERLEKLKAKLARV